MINNDVLRSVRYSLDLGDHHVVTLCQLADPAFAVDTEQVKAWLRRDDEAGFEAMNDSALAHFLDGLIVHLRGRDESQPQRAVETRIDNNLVLKKLRVAFQLRDVDLMEIFASAGFNVSKSEIGALFRQPGHTNYRRCLDQMLRNFLKVDDPFYRSLDGKELSLDAPPKMSKEALRRRLAGNESSELEVASLPQ